MRLIRGAKLMDPVEPTNDRVDLELPDGMPPLADIRLRIRMMLADVGDDVLVDLMLVATELVSNAYEHARPPRRLRLHRLPEQGVVRVQVDDSTPGRFPVLGRLAPVGVRNRGLLVVNLVAQTWGYVRRLDAKTVWADVPTFAGTPGDGLS